MVAARLANLSVGNPDFANTANLRNSVVRQDEAATKLNVSERTVNTAKKVQKQGVPELVEAVDRGTVSVSVHQAISN